MPQQPTALREITRIRVVDLITPTEEVRDQGTLPQLAESLKKGQWCPIITRGRKQIIAGRRRTAAAKLAGLEWLDAIDVGDEVSDAQAKQIEITETFHRVEFTDQQKWMLLSECLIASPGMDQKDLAAVVDLDASSITRYTTMSRAIPEVQEAFKNGLFGIGVGYSIAKAKQEDQLGMLNMRLSGASRDTLEQVGRKRRNGRKSAKSSRVQLILPSRINIVVNGDRLSLEVIAQSLMDALKEVKKAVEQQLDLKTLASVMKDKAKAKVVA
jgi:ParB family transcriptional regulator, chromosome partitioning protein